MVVPFISEFGFQPAPLELSGNRCSHDCIYCFANIRKEARILDLNSLIKIINKPKPTTYTDFLLNEGYPICFSNRSDPFSKTNYKQSIAIVKELNKLKNGLLIQTKGGYGIDEFIEASDGKPMTWYITISTIDENIRKRIEPNAPSSEERFELAKKLKDKGYHVVIALNPCYEGWLPKDDFYKYIDKLKEYGLNYVWIEALHLTKREIDSFRENRKIKWTNDELSDSLNEQKLIEYMYWCLTVLRENNIEVFKIGAGIGNNFFKPYRDTFGMIFPNYVEFINYCKKNGAGIYSFDEYYNECVDNKPFFEKDFKEAYTYLMKQSIHVWKKNDDYKYLHTLKKWMEIQWNEKRVKSSMQNIHTFRAIINNDGELLRDEKNNILLYFDGFNHIERSINIKLIKNEKSR